MIKRTFILERGMYDQHNDRVIVSGIKIPEGRITITQGFQAQLPHIGVAKVYVEDNVLKCDAEIHEDFIHLFPSIGFKPIKFCDNLMGGMDMQECDLTSLAVSPHPNMDKEIKRICDQKQVMVCSKLADKCMSECPSPEDKTICPNVKLKCYG